MRFLNHPAVQFALILLVATILRCDTFGDPNLHGDETFYFTVGIAMHQGALPYVDIWDRKPFGLFALNWIFAAISSDPLAYQLAATLFVALTGLVIVLIARRWANPGGALLAGIAYPFLLLPFQGFGGQSPVFYNLFIALAALLVLRAGDALRDGRAPPSVLAAMLSAGFAVTIKTTALFEAAFLGLYAATLLARSPVGWRAAAPRIAVWALAGAAPTLLVAGTYWLLGHWSEFWNAMIASNLRKDPPDFYSSSIRLRIMFATLAPIVGAAAFGLLDMGTRAERRFVGLWLGASALGVAVIPQFYLHYALPLLVPLCVAAAAFLGRGLIGLGVSIAIAALAWRAQPPFDFDHTRRSQQAMGAILQAIAANDDGTGLFLYDAPPLLYPLSGHAPPTPLVFPTHFSHLIEKDVSHLNTAAELRRVLAQRPGTVVMSVYVRNGPDNPETRAMIRRYVADNCRLVTVLDVPERLRHDFMAVFAGCARPKRQP